MVGLGCAEAKALGQRSGTVDHGLHAGIIGASEAATEVVADLQQRGVLAVKGALPRHEDVGRELRLKRVEIVEFGEVDPVAELVEPGIDNLGIGVHDESRKPNASVASKGHRRLLVMESVRGDRHMV